MKQLKCIKMGNYGMNSEEKLLSEDVLTVQKLIDYLKKQDPNAYILSYDPNSNSLTHNLGILPNIQIHTVAEDKIYHEKNLHSFYSGSDNKEEKIKEDMIEMYCYSNDNDIVFNLI